MQRSRMALNVVKLDERLISAKFDMIKSDIENSFGQVSILYSNFVSDGLIAFSKYCESQTNSKYIWKRFDPLSKAKTTKNELIYAEIYGDIDYERR